MQFDCVFNHKGMWDLMSSQQLLSFQLFPTGLNSFTVDYSGDFQEPNYLPRSLPQTHQVIKISFHGKNLCFTAVVGGHGPELGLSCC